MYRKYFKLDLQEVRRQVTSFAENYPFITSAFLYPGREIGTPYFIVFIVPSYPREMAKTYSEFRAKIDGSPRFYLDLERMYNIRRAEADIVNEWRWCEAHDDKGNMDGLSDFILTSDPDPVLLYSKTSLGEPINKKTIRDIGREGGKRPKRNVILDEALKGLFEKEPHRLKNSARLIWKYFQKNYGGFSELTTASGSLHFDFDDEVLVAEFDHGDGTNKFISFKTFQRYVSEVKKQFK